MQRLFTLPAPLPTLPPPDHNARAVAQISLVDEYERVLCNLYVRPEAPVVSYLTPLTGLTPELLERHGMPLARAVGVLTAALPPSAVLVGQNISKDVQWLGLREGQHFEQARGGGGWAGGRRPTGGGPALFGRPAQLACRPAGLQLLLPCRYAGGCLAAVPTHPPAPRRR